MRADKAETNKKYITKSGIPVTVLNTEGKMVLLKIETTGNTTEVAKDYELLPYDESKLDRMAKILMGTNGKGAKGPKKKTESLAAIIDPMLFAGGYTIREIAAELAKKAGDLAKGKDIEANVRARMVSFRRKGWPVQKDAQKRVRVVRRD